MAENFVIKDTEESNVRWIPEPRFLARLRRLKAIWNAFRFLARGGKFKVYLDFSGVDPRILKPVRLFVVNDGMVVDVDFYKRNAVAVALNRIGRETGLVLARDDEPGFRVRWTESAQEKAWEEAGFDVTRTPDRITVQPKS